MVNIEPSAKRRPYLPLKNITSPRNVVIASKLRALSHTLGVVAPVGWMGLGEGPKEYERPGVTFHGSRAHVKNEVPLTANGCFTYRTKPECD